MAKKPGDNFSDLETMEESQKFDAAEEPASPQKYPHTLDECCVEIVTDKCHDLQPYHIKVGGNTYTFLPAINLHDARMELLRLMKVEIIPVKQKEFLEATQRALAKLASGKTESGGTKQ